jgi:hypothetical protein
LNCSEPTDVQPYPGRCNAFEPVAWTPAAMARDVPVDTALGVTFTDYPDPDTLNASSMLLTTGIFWHPGLYHVDLVSRTAHFRLTSPLRAGLGYTLTVFPALRSLQGCPTPAQQRSFQTSDAMVTPAAPAAPPTLRDVLPIFARSCGGVACHRQPADDTGGAPAGGDGCLPAPAKGLSLCDAQAWDGLVGVPSKEVSRLKLVAPRDASRSYLLRKLLPGDTPGGAAPTTLGHRDPPGAPLNEAELRVIASWIDGGALR